MGKLGSVISALIITNQSNGGWDIEFRHRQYAQQQQTDLISGESRGPFFEKEPHSDQEMMSQESKQHRMVPAQPTAQFVMVEADLDLIGPEKNFDRPAHAADPHQFSRVKLSWRIAEVVFDFAWVLQVAAHDEPEFLAQQPIPHFDDPQAGEITHQRLLG